MTYQETLDYLYNALPMFQRVGASAFKKDLSNTIALCNYLGNPERKFKSVHIAGTNGKGSSSHSIASVLQESGYKTGLYTSPHLKSFTERIRINGKEIPQDQVIQFVEENKEFIEKLKPSFFEMTVGMAFWFFAKEEVDIAVVEVGMGGRLDSTNILQPEVSLITNIGWDHVQFLGNTLEEIAGEKAGIIKAKTPVIISLSQQETTPVFKNIAQEKEAPITFADQKWEVKKVEEKEGKAVYEVTSSLVSHQLKFDLLGNYQRFNLPGILETLVQLQLLGWEISQDATKKGLAQVSKTTGLKGRWQLLSNSPLTICDTGHNEAGIQEILNQLESYSYDKLWLVLGMVQDKDISKILLLLPKTASYVFCEANLPRAMKADELLNKAQSIGLKGKAIPNVNDAINFARKKAGLNDLIFVGGSTFVVAEIEEL